MRNDSRTFLRSPGDVACVCTSGTASRGRVGAIVRTGVGHWAGRSPGSGHKIRAAGVFSLIASEIEAEEVHKCASPPPSTKSSLVARSIKARLKAVAYDSPGSVMLLGDTEATSTAESNELT